MHLRNSLPHAIFLGCLSVCTALLADPQRAIYPHAVEQDTGSSAHRHALEFVDQAKIGENLPVMALWVASQTVSFKAIASELGHARAEDVISEEINRLLPLYQPQWNEKIALAYEVFFTQEELSSLASEGSTSEFVGKVKAHQARIGKHIESSSKPILVEMVTQALKAATSQNPGAAAQLLNRTSPTQ